MNRGRLKRRLSPIRPTEAKDDDNENDDFRENMDSKRFRRVDKNFSTSCETINRHVSSSAGILSNRSVDVATSGVGEESSNPRKTITPPSSSQVSICRNVSPNKYVNDQDNWADTGLLSKAEIKGTSSGHNAVPDALIQRHNSESVVDTFCQICQKDISRYNSQRRLQHLNRCIDELESAQNDKKQIGEVAVITRIPDCPICGQKLKSQTARRMHLKKCATVFNISPVDLMQITRKQEHEDPLQLLGISTGKESGERRLQGNPQNPVRKKNHQTRNRVKEPRNKLEEDIQLAIALSTSIEEDRRNSLIDFVELDCIHPEEEIKVEEMKHSTPIPCRDAFSVIMSQKAKEFSLQSKRVKKNKKHPTSLLALDQDEVKRRLTAKVTALILQKSNVSPMPRLSSIAVPESKLPAKYCNSKGQASSSGSSEEYLWHLASQNQKMTCYYVERLAPPIVPVVNSDQTYTSWIQDCQEKNLSGEHGKHVAEEHHKGERMETVLYGSTQTALVLAELAAEAGSDATFYGEPSQKFVGMIPRESRAIQTSQFPAVNDVSVSKGFCFETVEASDKATSDLLRAWDRMVDDPHLSDLTLECKNGSVIHLHRLLLAVRCPNLLKVLDSEFGKTGLKEFSKTATLSVVRFLYCADVDIPHDVVFEANRIAESFDLTDFCKICQNIIRTFDLSDSTHESTKNAAETTDDAITSSWHEAGVGYRGEHEGCGGVETVDENDGHDLDEVYTFMLTQKWSIPNDRNVSDENECNLSRRKSTISDSEDDKKHPAMECPMLDETSDDDMLIEFNESLLRKLECSSNGELVTNEEQKTLQATAAVSGSGTMQFVNGKKSLVEGTNTVTVGSSCQAKSTRIYSHKSETDIGMDCGGKILHSRVYSQSDEYMSETGKDSCSYVHDDFVYPVTNRQGSDESLVISNWHLDEETKPSFRQASENNGSHSSNRADASKKLEDKEEEEEEGHYTDIVNLSTSEEDDLFLVDEEPKVDSMMYTSVMPLKSKSSQFVDDIMNRVSSETIPVCGTPCVVKPDDCSNLSPDLFSVSPYSNNFTSSLTPSVFLRGKQQQVLNEVFRDHLENISNAEESSQKHQDVCGSVTENCIIGNLENSVRDGNQNNSLSHEGFTNNFQGKSSDSPSLKLRTSVSQPNMLQSCRKNLLDVHQFVSQSSKITEDDLLPDLDVDDHNQKEPTNKVMTHEIASSDSALHSHGNNYNELFTNLKSFVVNSENDCHILHVDVDEESKCSQHFSSLRSKGSGILLPISDNISDQSTSKYQFKDAEEMDRKMEQSITDAVSDSEVIICEENKEELGPELVSFQHRNEQNDHDCQMEAINCDDNADIWENFPEEDYIPYCFSDNNLNTSKANLATPKSIRVGRPESLARMDFSPPTDMETDVSALMEDVINSSLLQSDISFETSDETVAKANSDRHPPLTSARNTKTVLDIEDCCPVTPKPGYGHMNTPDLQHRCHEYGIRRLPKKQMVKVLDNIYYELHPGVRKEDWEETGKMMQKDGKKTKKKKTETAGGLKKHLMSTTGATTTNKRPVAGCLDNCGTNLTYDSHQKKTFVPAAKPGTSTTLRSSDDSDEFLDLSCADTDMFGEEEDDEDDDCLQSVPEESIVLMPKKKKTKADEQAKLDDSTKKKILQNFFSSNTDIYQRILNYEPLEIDYLKNLLKENGIKIALNVLIDFLDEQNILFSTRNSQVGWNNKGPEKKKPGYRKDNGSS